MKKFILLLIITLFGGILYANTPQQSVLTMSNIITISAISLSYVIALVGIYIKLLLRIQKLETNRENDIKIMEEVRDEVKELNKFLREK